MKKLFLLFCMSFLMFSTTGCTMFKQTLEPTLTEIVNSDKTYTYKNSKNKIIFDHISCKLMFKNGYSVINDGEKYGVVNTRAEYVIPKMYDFIADESDGMYACLIETVDGAKICYYNNKFELAVSPRIADLHLNAGDGYDYNFYHGLALYREPETHKYGYLDKTGNMIIPAKYDWAETFTDEIAPVGCNNGKCYFIDITGAVKRTINATIIQKYSDGLAAVWANKWGYIDKTGNWVIKPKYGCFECPHDGEFFVCDFYKGYAGVYLGSGYAPNKETISNQFAIIDKTGRIIKRFDYLYPENFDKNGEPTNEMQPVKPNGTRKYIVRMNGKEYEVDYSGKVIQCYGKVMNESWY